MTSARIAASYVNIEQTPGFWHTLQVVLASILEPNARAGDSADVRTPKLDLAKCGGRHEWPGQAVCAFSNCLSAVDSPGGSTERGENTIARGLDLPSFEAVQLPTDHVIVSLNQVKPSRIAERAGTSGGIHDVGEQDNREQRLYSGSLRSPVRELLYLPNDLFRILLP
jgi:hypothetical protein